MTTSPATLHLLAHQAQLRARTSSDWWDNPLDTALAAMSASRHSPAYRHDGELAVKRLRRWLAGGEARRVSANTAAIALTAAAAANLGLRGRDLDAEAIRTAADLATRSRDAVPPLHLALTVWALDGIVPERTASPWPRLREHMERGATAKGRDGALLALAAALSAAAPDASGLVQDLLTRVPGSPSLEDGAVLLWVLTVAIERAALALPPSDSGLRALTDRRAELAERLAQELDGEAFSAPEIADFDPDLHDTTNQTIYLAPLEALLLDLSLVSGEREHPWLRFEEAADLFGRRERDAVFALARRTAALTTVAGLFAGATLSTVMLANSVRAVVAVAAGAILASAMMCGATAVLFRSRNSPLSAALLAFAATLTVTSGLDLANELVRPHPLPDATSVIVGLIIPIACAVIIAALTKSS